MSFWLAYRRRQKRPKMVVICDISTSMRYCSELMLSLIQAIQDQIAKKHGSGRQSAGIHTAVL